MVQNRFRVGDRVVRRSGLQCVYSVGEVRGAMCRLFRGGSFVAEMSHWELRKAEPIPGAGGRREQAPPDRATVLQAERARLLERLAEVDTEISNLLVEDGS